MLLRTKLIIGFSCVLLLTVIISYSSYHSLEQMSALGTTTTQINTAFNYLQSAQSSEQDYAKAPKKDLANFVRKQVDLSRQQFQTVQKYEQNNQEKYRELNTIIEMTTEFDKIFNQLENEINTADDINRELATYSKPALQNIQNLKKAVISLFNETKEPYIFSVYELVTQAENNFMFTRLTSWEFTADPTENTAQTMYNYLNTALGDLGKALSLVQRDSNKQLINQVSTNLKNYEDCVRRYNVVFLKQIASTRSMQSHMEKTMLQVNNLSTRYSHELITVQLTAMLQLGLATGIALLIGITASMIITRNVLRQLGRDPSILEYAANNVAAGNFEIDDGYKKTGVYANFISMVIKLKENIETAHSESTRAQAAAHTAQEATRHAEEAKKRAETAKQEGMLAAAAQLEEVVAIITSASTQLAAQIEQSKRGATQQADRVHETATAMEEMNCTVLEVAKNASTAVDVSITTRKQAESGSAIVRQAVQSIQAVQDQSITLRNDMRKLDENAQAISQIMGVISDIADQTNLLALNAAIEAARAGDAGRGFAVVADEVRKLAEKTMTSTIDVGNTIKSIQQSTTQSISQMDISVKFIAEATAFANQSGGALQEIVTMVDSTVDQVRAIATAAEEQSATSEEINRSMTHVNVIATETAQAMQEASQAVGELAKQSQKLNELIEAMKHDEA